MQNNNLFVLFHFIKSKKRTIIMNMKRKNEWKYFYELRLFLFLSELLSSLVMESSIAV